MKLNEKGFAFSTMLYGSITLIVIVLYIILNVNKRTNDTTYYFGEELVKSLNECVTEEIALENCYSSGSHNCNATAYHACLGVSDINSPNQGVIISEIIKEQIADDNYEPNRYIYTGSNPHNYLSYSGKLWRIVSVEPGGYLKLIDTNKFATTAWDTYGNGVWGDNSIYQLLNVNYLSTITDTSKIYQGSWRAAILYPSLNIGYSLNEMVEQINNTPIENIKYAKVGVLSISDYLKATNNMQCVNYVMDINSYNCNSWLTQYKGWTLEINGEFGSDHEGYAFYFGEKNELNNKVLYDRTTEELDIYPVIYLDRNSIYKSGNGTEQDPYTIK